MAKKLKAGDFLHGYRITKVFGPGMMAISYAAESCTRQKVFFKQYKSPSPTVVWYDGFVVCQKELSARVRSGAAAQFAFRSSQFASSMHLRTSGAVPAISRPMSL